MGKNGRTRVGIACQGGGSHTAFTAGVLQGALTELPDDVEVVALSGTSGGAICAALAWEGFLRDDLRGARERLGAFWQAMSATEPWDQVANRALTTVMSLRDLSVLPEVSPYHLPTWGEDRFRTMLEEHIDFEEARKLASRPGAPALLIGAVEVLGGRFEIFEGSELSVECLMASAAIPELYRAIQVPGRGVYWDGLFSQNPPIRDLLHHSPDEIWVIQINSFTCSRIPTETHQILDRRNELSGNLSMVQELFFIDAINRALLTGVLSGPKYRQVKVERIQLDRELDYRTKMDRSPELLTELREYGLAKWRWFVDERDTRRRYEADVRRSSEAEQARPAGADT